MSSKISDGLGPTGIREPYSPTENQEKNCEIALFSNISMVISSIYGIKFASNQKTTL